jgi:hypothetical protein
MMPSSRILLRLGLVLEAQGFRAAFSPQAIFEAGDGMRKGNAALGIVQTQDRKTKTVRLHHPPGE